MTDFPALFLKAMAFSLKWETGGDLVHGGYLSPVIAARRGDPGRETKWGVSKQAHPDLDIAALTLEDAYEQVYFPHYWQAAGNQESYCSEMPWPLSFVHFDCTVNVGNRKVAQDGTVVLHRKANMILQRALEVDDDGYIGPVTRAAIAACDPVHTALAAIRQRDFYYSTLGSWSRDFTLGWHRRTNALRAEILRPPLAAAGNA
jgi:lysozyme family protein